MAAADGDVGTPSAAPDARERAVLDAALDCVISIDDRGRVSYFNSSAERTFGYSRDEAIGRDLAELIMPPALRDAHRRGLRRHLATGESRILDRRVELSAMRADGSLFPAELTVTRVESPSGPGFTAFVRDITDRLQAAHDLRAAQRRVIEAGYAAREQITRDIHDGAQQQFVNTLINLQLAQQKWSSERERARELLDVACAEAEAGIENLRRLAAGIHPAILTDRGLPAALDSLAARMPIPVSLDVANVELSPVIAVIAYFFCSEALTNVIKHAAASEAWVSVSARDDELTIEVRDDGVGGATLDSAGTGLVGLGDRVSALDGRLELTSPGRGAGTTLTARIPLPG
ncbi:MAG: PAS domain S-box protein [Solirubrobacteraceae bacterium]